MSSFFQLFQNIRFFLKRHLHGQMVCLTRFAQHMLEVMFDCVNLVFWLADTFDKQSEGSLTQPNFCGQGLT